jgi:hypothetical protein
LLPVGELPFLSMCLLFQHSRPNLNGGLRLLFWLFSL